MKDKLVQMGWVCALCTCPGKKGYDCGHRNFPGVVIQERTTHFKIFRKGVIVESAPAYELENKLKTHGLWQP